MTDAVAIAWINDPGPHGQWGSPNELTLPINERGLLLADGLFETVLILDGQPRLLAEHLDRWHHAAALLGLAKPPDKATVEPLSLAGLMVQPLPPVAPGAPGAPGK